HPLREFVVVPVLQDELDLVLFSEDPEIRVRLLGLHPRSGAFHVHHVPKAAALPLIGHEGIERAQIDLAVRLEGMVEGVREPTSGLSPWTETYISLRSNSSPFRRATAPWACMCGCDARVGT